MSKFKLIKISLWLAVSILVALPVYAIQFESSDNVHISNLHQLEDDLYAWGTNVTLDGTVEGDFTSGGMMVITNGYVENSANIFAERFKHTGEIGGSLRAFAQNVEIDGYVGRSILSFSQEFTLASRGLVEQEIVLHATKININGTVKGKATIHGETVTITGTIENDLEIYAVNINIIPPALIKGNLKYVSPNQANIDIASGVTILGDTSWDLPDKDTQKDNTFTAVVLAVSKLIAAFLLGLLLFSFSRKYIDETVNQLKNRFSVSAATGLLAVLVFLLVVVILVISLAMIIAGLFLISGDQAILGAFILSLSIMMIPITGFLTVSGGVIFYCGKIVVGILLGYFIYKIFNKNVVVVSRLQLLVGLTALTLIFNLPYVGYLLYIIISIIGAGAIIQGIRNCRHENHFPKESSPPPEGR